MLSSLAPGAAVPYWLVAERRAYRNLTHYPMGGSGSAWNSASSVLLWSCDKFTGGGSGALLRSSFLFNVLGTLGNFVIDVFDFSSEVKVLRILGVGFE